MIKPVVRDELSEVVAPLLSTEPAKPKGDRLHISDRLALTSILFVLKSRIAVRTEFPYP
jgi:hypothetical protein